jgi:capsular polysaccharide biosynthesis protein
VDNDEPDGKGVFHALARRWTWLVAGAVGGAVLAGALVVALPKRYTATGEVLLHPIDGDNSEQVSRMDTAAELAHSIPVAEQALQVLGSGDDPERFLRQYSASRLTNQLLRIEARASSADLAVRRVSAVAEAYLDYLAAEAAEERASIERTVQPRTTALEARLAQLDVQIAGLGPTGDVLTPEQELLLDQRAAVAAELATAEATLNQARADERLALDRDKLVAPPLPPKRPTSPRPREFLGIGLLAGTMLAVGAVLARDVLSHRLFRREDLARAAGVSVVASPALRVRGAFGRRVRPRRLARLMASPTSELSAAAAAILSVWRSGQTPRSPRLVVVSMAADEEALAVVLRLASDLAGEVPVPSQRRDIRRRPRSSVAGAPAERGRGVLVTDVSTDDSSGAGRVLRAMTGMSGADAGAWETARTFRVTRSADAAVEWAPVGVPPDTVARADVFIAFAGDWRSAAARAQHLRALEAEASLVVVRAGYVTSANVQESAAALRRAGAPPLGLVVVDPDRFDSSTGQLPPEAGGEPVPPTESAAAPEAHDDERGTLRRL